MKILLRKYPRKNDYKKMTQKKAKKRGEGLKKKRGEKDRDGEFLRRPRSLGGVWLTTLRLKDDCFNKPGVTCKGPVEKTKYQRKREKSTKEMGAYSKKKFFLI